jgi:hypothetical protein
LSFALPVSAADFLSSTHFFPVVSRTDGLAGTQWTTSLEIFNPHPRPLTITVHLSAAGGFSSEIVEVPAGETRRWADVMGELFGAIGNGALLAEAEADRNDQLAPECRAFGAAMRISTAGHDRGSYGQTVASLDPSSGFLGDWTGYLPGVALWGDPGIDGFRTNVGIWNIGPDEARMRLRILDPSGQQVWQTTLTAARHEPEVIALPRDLDLETGTLVADGFGEWLDCAVFISVVDNLTGDATFRTPQLADPDQVGGCGPAAAAPPDGRGDCLAAAERVRALFVGGLR